MPRCMELQIECAIRNFKKELPLPVIVALTGEFHLGCVGLKCAPKRKEWFCRFCYGQDVDV